MDLVQQEFLLSYKTASTALGVLEQKGYVSETKIYSGINGGSIAYREVNRDKLGDFGESRKIHCINL